MPNHEYYLVQNRPYRPLPTKDELENIFGLRGYVSKYAPVEELSYKQKIQACFNQSCWFMFETTSKYFNDPSTCGFKATRAIYARFPERESVEFVVESRIFKVFVKIIDMVKIPTDKALNPIIHKGIKLFRYI